MMRAATFVASLLTLAACGGDGGTNPPQPPVNAVASLTRADSSILQFTGRRVALSKLFTAKDANGVALPSARLSCVTPAGFTLTGDSLVAPTVEARGKLRCSATTIAAVAGLAGVAVDPTDSLTVTAGIDLRAYTWHVHWRCTGGDEYWDQLGGTSTKADSVDYDGRVLNWQYPADTGYFVNVGGLADMMFRGQRTLFKGGVAAYQDTVQFSPMTVMRQMVDSMQVHLSTGGGQIDTLARVGTAVPRRYEGRNWCNAPSYHTYPIGPVTLEEVLP